MTKPFSEISRPGLVVSVTGLGYVGLPLALAFARKCRVVGYDASSSRIAALRRADDSNREVPPELFSGCDIEFTDDSTRLAEADFHIVAIPTPVDSAHAPDISLLLDAMRTVGRALKKGDTVVVESTVYPGCTEEDCMPVLQEESGLTADVDFNLGYSPERINPGDKLHTLESEPKVVSGRTPQALDVIAEAYASVIPAGVYRAQSIKVAEAAKILENTQRDVNIALMNEASMIFSRMGVDTGEVLKAAATKWNFLPFHPGLVGGHCIGVDPYYLDFKARKLGYNTQIINQGRFVNDSMGRYVAGRVVKMLIAAGWGPTSSRVLIMGFTYKENVADVRNTRVVDIIDELRSFGVPAVDVVDPVASKHDSMRLYGFAPQDEPRGVYSAVIVATPHDCFRTLTPDFFISRLEPGGVIADLYGVIPRIDGFFTWRL